MLRWNMLTTLLTIAVLHWLALLTPGVNTLLITQLAASGERRAAGYAAVGITAVAFTWALLAVLGVTAIFTVYPELRQALQIAGAAYLVYVAVRLWQSSAGSASASSHEIGPLAAFRLGFLTNIMNPKSALFFGSVFAAALPEAPSTEMMVAALCVAVTNTFSWHMLLAVALSHARVQAAYARQSKLLGRIAGVLVGAFGLYLLIATVQEAREK